MFADPILTGRYPDENFAALMPGPVEDDLRTISTPLDWYGVNYYNPTLVGAPRADALETFSGFGMPAELPFGIREIEGYEKTDFGWPVVPDGLRETLVQLQARYGDRLLPSTSPRTAAPSTRPSPTPAGSPSSKATWAPCAPRSTQASTSAATSPGR